MIIHCVALTLTWGMWLYLSPHSTASPPAFISMASALTGCARFTCTVKHSQISLQIHWYINLPAQSNAVIQIFKFIKITNTLCADLAAQPCIKNICGGHWNEVGMISTVLKYDRSSDIVVDIVKIMSKFIVCYDILLFIWVKRRILLFMQVCVSVYVCVF
jgi:hypothetical protein